MTEKNIIFKGKTKRVAKAVKDVPQDKPEEHFSNGIAINPTEFVRLELGSKQLTARAIYLIRSIELGQRGLIVAPPGCKTQIVRMALFKRAGLVLAQFQTTGNQLH